LKLYIKINLKKIHNYLKEEVSGYSLAIFRILFGSILFIQSIYWVFTGFIQKNIIEPTFLFPFIEGLNPLSSNFMIYGLNSLLLISSFAILINRFYRTGLIIYLFSFTYLWLLCQGYFNNHYYLFSLICFLLIFSKSLFSNTEKVRIPRLYLFILQALIISVYIIAGINKINPYWLLDLQPMKYILGQIGASENSFLIPIFTYFGLFFDLLIGPLLLLKRTRLFAIITAILFHVTNFFIFILANGEIGFFPFVMIATLILFIDSNKLESYKLKPNARLLSRHTYAKKVSILLLFFLIIQIILPFRHVFFKGYVDYNGIGQRFSWRLKNMYKETYPEDHITFYVKHPKEPVNMITFGLYPGKVDFLKDSLKIHLTSRQKTNILYYPNVLSIFAKKMEPKLIEFLKNKEKEIENFNAPKNLIINGKYQIGFMGRETQLHFDTTIDLTNKNEVPIKTYSTNTWLNPLK